MNTAAWTLGWTGIMLMLFSVQNFCELIWKVTCLNTKKEHAQNMNVEFERGFSHVGVFVSPRAVVGHDYVGCGACVCGARA